ncbi:hypothetical protein TNCT_630581 [Trichonephila clavata]|uniref:Uncharacterized protein n=1 Tax=Trichonephila clavata TaxID=2740835 RepID=A0A8X6HY62_TRICU|nr:hypothetical protein TNCT_630581 [Trichonephila clavata]
MEHSSRLWREKWQQRNGAKANFPLFPLTGQFISRAEEEEDLMMGRYRVTISRLKTRRLDRPFLRPLSFSPLAFSFRENRSIQIRQWE